MNRVMLTLVPLLIGMVNWSIASALPSKNKDSIRQATIKRWATIYPRLIQPTRHSILLITSAQNCASCGAFGIKRVAELVRDAKLDINLIVVAFVESIGDGRKLRRLFPSLPIIEDAEDKAFEVFELDTLPVVLVVWSNGTIRYRHTDPVHRPITMDTLLSFLPPTVERKQRSTAEPKQRAQNLSSKSSIKENHCALAHCSSSAFDQKTKRTIVLDDVNNQLVVVDISTRQILDCIEPDSILDLYFLPPTNVITHPDNTVDTVRFARIRQRFAEYSLPMTKFSRILSYSNDTLRLIARMMTSPLYEADPHRSGKYSLTFKVSSVLLTLLYKPGTSPVIVSASILSQPDSLSMYFLSSTFTETNDGRIAVLAKTELGDSSRIDIVEITSFNDNLRKHQLPLPPFYQPEGKQKVVSTRSGTATLQELENYNALCATGNTYYLVLPSFRQAFRCFPQDTGFTYHTIHLSTRMHINASSGSECKISRDEIPYFTQAFLYRKLLNLAYLSAKPPRIIIEQYATTLLKEIKINLRAPTLDDQLLSAYILEPVTDKVYLLCKWKKSRWHLHQIALD